jgi:DNA-binding NarL/FixJ family response regulator
MTRVFLADDQALVRGGFRLILEVHDDIEVVGEAQDGLEAVEGVLRTKPDVVLMDVRMPGIDGIEATRRVLRRATRPPRVLMLTTFDLDEYLYGALRAGASGFLLKSVAPAGLADAVRTVASGDALLSPSLTRRLIEEHARRPRFPTTQHPELAELTEREHEVLRLIARGLSNAELARELVITEATVKTHVTRVLAKLELRDRVQAVVFAYESGLVLPGDNSLTDVSSS